MFNKLFFYLFTLLCLPAGAYAEIKLPHLICDNMILQHSTQARLWGWSEPGNEIQVSVSWADTPYKTKTSKQGKWEIAIQTPKASYTPHTIVFQDKHSKPITISNVLAGEVWVCAGQSNMEMPIRGFWGCPIEDSNETIVSANRRKGIHFVKIPSTMSTTPLEDAPCEWKTADARNVADCSAAGYFFASTLNQVIDVPVGLILANKGGTRVESWLNKTNLEQYTDDPTDSLAIVKKFPQDYHRSLLWGNGTFHPIINYTIKGILFYQGCSNVGNPEGQYAARLKLLVEQWRKDFRQGEFPFYFVQIAPYRSGDKDGDWNTRLRHEQFEASKIIPNSGIVCTQDLVYPYEADQIHPTRKKEIGQRLAYLTLNKQYGLETLPCQSASYKQMTIKDNTCYIQLDNTYDSMNRMQDIEGFEIAGADKIFYPATATWSHEQGVAVKSEKVNKPVAVRYGWRNFQITNFANAAGLPLFPFRTDKW